MSTSPFTSITEDPIRKQFVIGASDGKLRFFDLGQSAVYIRPLNEFALDTMVSKYFSKKEPVAKAPQFTIVSSEPVWKQQNDYLQRMNDTPDEPEVKRRPNILFLSFFESGNASRILVVGTPSCIIYFNVSSNEIMSVIEYSDSILDTIGMASLYEMTPRENDTVCVYYIC
jgi:hypothetical protein